tara:strand:+ start:1662 stop:2069 length:408 start_codon:yes stop_codon:yes gene_type:complete
VAVNLHRVVVLVLTVSWTVALASSCAGSTNNGHDHDAGSYVVDPAEVTVDDWFEVEVRDGLVVGGVPRFKVSTGRVVSVLLTVDRVDQVHLHVYDAVADVGPGVEGQVVVRAAVPGVFEAELHGSGLRVFELEVS